MLTDVTKRPPHLNPLAQSQTVAASWSDTSKLMFFACFETKIYPENCAIRFLKVHQISWCFISKTWEHLLDSSMENIFQADTRTTFLYFSGILF